MVSIIGAAGYSLVFSLTPLVWNWPLVWPFGMELDGTLYYERVFFA